MKRLRNLGFSLVEVFVAIAVLGVVASVAYAQFGRVREAAREEKLQSDVNALNRAVSVYQAGGGSLEGRNTVQKVLRNLRKSAKGEVANRMPGISSSVIDQRIWVEMQVNKEWKADVLRAYWDYDARRFTLASSGPKGIKQFVLNDELAEKEFGKEDRSAAMLYASSDGWVWDYQDFALSSRTVPTVVLTNPTLSGIPAGGNPTGAPPAVDPPVGILLSPEFSLPGGTYSIPIFDLTVSLTNPNPAGSSELYYAIDGGTLTAYAGPLTVAPETIVEAQAISIDAKFSDSARRSEAYAAERVTLSPPEIETDRDAFGLFFGFNVNVTLNDSNPSGTAQTRYRLNGGSWMTYTGPFNLVRFIYPDGVLIEAQCITAGSEYYLSSSVSMRTISHESLDLTGNASGVFHDPVGQSNMVTNLPPGTSSSTFNWGNGSGSGRSQSWMEMNGGSFGNVAAGERFSIGELTYYNGTIASGTGAETIDLDVNLSLDINGNTFNPFFEFTFELINTPNNGGPSNPWPDADYVKLEDSRSSRTLVINGYQYEFRLEFGETSDDGFAQFDEFHVLENRDAQVTVYGTFISLGPVETEGGGTLIDESTLSSPTSIDKTGSEPVVDSVLEPVYQKEGYVDSKEISTGYVQVAKEAADEGEIAADEGENAADQAEKKAQEAIDELEKGAFTSAVTKTEEAKVESGKADDANQKAGDAAVKAKQAASDADRVAIKDAAAEEDATAAIDEYYRASDAYSRARNAKSRANDAATKAETAVSSGVGGTGTP